MDHELFICKKMIEAMFIVNCLVSSISFIYIFFKITNAIIEMFEDQHRGPAKKKIRTKEFGGKRGTISPYEGQLGAMLCCN